jgi:16S rRNA (cytosine967-C5)-methyltransferase
LSRYHSYLRSAVSILEQYKGQEPFAGWLKKYFAQHKKFGSGDRKQVGRLCYAFFRCGKMQADRPLEERILTSIFLCSKEPDPVLGECKPEWNERILLPLMEKLKVTGLENDTNLIFPFNHERSTEAANADFELSHLQQPSLFLRIRPGCADQVIHILQQAQIHFEQLSPTALALPNSAKADSVLEPDSMSVVQDFSSQRIADLLPFADLGKPLMVWDCCAGSGGKSLLVHDTYPDVLITATDRRDQILFNLLQRFRTAGVKNYKAYTADLSKTLPKDPGRFDLVLADVPCSGSGTWGRTPEQLVYFDEQKVSEYSALQQEIALRAATAVKPGGHFLYITCSVFRAENEDVAELLQQKAGLVPLKSGLITGYAQKADSLFAALFQKPL